MSLSFLNLAALAGQTLDDLLEGLQLEEEGDVLTDDELLLLENLVRRPLDLNQVRRRQLEDIPLMGTGDVSLILASRDSLVRFSSVDQVSAIPGLSLLASRLVPLIATVNKTVPVDISLRNRLVSSGEDARLLTQLGFHRSNVSGGFTFERDPRESALLDFATGYVVTTLKKGARLLVGNHQMISGYGLLFGRSTRPIKGYDSVTRLARLGKGLHPYRSVTEYWSLRGIAVEKGGPSGQWTISLSASPRDATVEDGRLLSTHPSGLHQTETAISRKHNLREDIVLLSWRRTGGTRWDYGTVMAHDRWTAQGSSLENRPPKTYGSIFGGLDLNDLKLFGELATSTGVGPSMLGGFVLVKDRLRWISSLRRYPAGFQGPRSQPFREWSSDRLNEMGLYQGLSLRTGKHHLLTYGDIYRQMSGDGESGRPVHGFEVAGTWSYRWRGGQGFFRWKRERKTVENSIVFPGEATPQETWRESWRVRMATAPRRPLTLQIQGDRTTASPGDTRHRGHGLSLRVRYSRHPWRTSFNWTAFSVNDYSSRIYVWDINLPGELRSKTFSSTGHSAAFLVGTSTTTGATMSIRARSTWRFSRQAEKWLRPTLEGGFQMDIAF